MPAGKGSFLVWLGLPWMANEYRFASTSMDPAQPAWFSCNIFLPPSGVDCKGVWGGADGRARSGGYSRLGPCQTTTAGAPPQVLSIPSVNGRKLLVQWEGKGGKRGQTPLPPLSPLRKARHGRPLALPALAPRQAAGLPSVHVWWEAHLMPCNQRACTQPKPPPPRSSHQGGPLKQQGSPPKNARYRELIAQGQPGLHSTPG